LAVHDAAQCYEEIDSDLVLTYLDEAILSAQKRGFKAVTVAKKKERTAGYAR